MFLFLLSLTGIPPTAGFVAKFAVILSAVRAGYVGLAVLAVLCTAVSAFFYLRIAVLMYMHMTESPPRRPHAFPCWGVGRLGGRDLCYHSRRAVPGQFHALDGAP